MAKKAQPESAVPPESITQGGSYVVGADGKPKRVEGTERPAPDLSPEPKAPAAADATETTATE